MSDKVNFIPRHTNPFRIRANDCSGVDSSALLMPDDATEYNTSRLQLVTHGPSHTQKCLLAIRRKYIPNR